MSRLALPPHTVRRRFELNGRDGTGMGGSGQDFLAGGAGDSREAAGPSVLTPPAGGVVIPAQRLVPAIGSPAVGGPPASPASHGPICPCVCGHDREAHVHYRPGTDCGACDPRDCAGFRPVGGRLRQWWRRAFPN